MTLPRAQAEQFDTQPYEHGLLELARTHFPTVRWWHDYRRARDLFGSYCYVCEQFIVTWNRFGSIPLDAQLAIDHHKREHRDGNRHRGTVTVEKGTPS